MNFLLKFMALQSKISSQVYVTGLDQEKGAEDVKSNNDFSARQITTLVLVGLRRHFGEFDPPGHTLASLI
jgi:hypothetical protein